MKNLLVKLLFVSSLVSLLICLPCNMLKATGSSPATISCDEGSIGDTENIFSPQLDNDTLTLYLSGSVLSQIALSDGRSVLNITLVPDNENVAVIDSFTFMAHGALVDKTLVNNQSGPNTITQTVLQAQWFNTITDGEAEITIMLKPGTVEGDVAFEITKISASKLGASDISNSFDDFFLSPSSVTNALEIPTVGGTIFSDVGNFTILGPEEIIAPGKVAISFQFDDIPANFVSATLNDVPVEFFGNKVLRDGREDPGTKILIGSAILEIPQDESELLLNLDIMTSPQEEDSIFAIMTMNIFGIEEDTDSTIVDLGIIPIIDSGIFGEAPSITSAGVTNRRSKPSSLDVIGRNLSTKEEITLNILPGNNDPQFLAIKNGRIMRAVFNQGTCIPNGAFVNVITPGGTAAKKLKVRGTCNNPLATLECRK